MVKKWRWNIKFGLLYVASISMDLPLSQTNCKPCGVYNCKIRFFKFFNDCMYNTIVIKSVSQYIDLKIHKSFMAYKYSMNIPMIILTKNEPLHDLLSIAKKGFPRFIFFEKKNLLQMWPRPIYFLFVFDWMCRRRLFFFWFITLRSWTVPLFDDPPRARLQIYTTRINKRLLF